MNGSEYKSSVPGCAAIASRSELITSVSGNSFIVISFSDKPATLLWSDGEISLTTISQTLKYDWSPECSILER